MTAHARPAFAVALLAVVALVAGCAEVVDGTPQATYGDVNPGEVAGLPVTDGPSGLRPGVPTAAFPVHNNGHTESDTLAVDALSDVYDYWRQEMPQDFDGQQFKSPSKLVSYDADGQNMKVCGGDSQGVANALYCPPDNSVNWDRGELLPFLIKQFGPLSVLTVLSHEMGHAVQFQLGAKSGISPMTPTIVLEQQADCYAGSFIRWTAAGHAAHFQLSTGPGLNTVLAAIFLVRDTVGQQDYTASGAHGTAFDRVYAFQAGFTDGPKRCAKIDVREIRGRQTERIFNRDEQQQNNGNLQVDGTTLPLLQYSLDQAFQQEPGRGPQIRQGGDRCPDGSGTPPASYCANENTVDINENQLNTIATLPSKQTLTSGNPNTPGGIGDFAAFAEIASRYALGVQNKLGIPLDDTMAGLRTTCLTGAWAGVVRNFIGPQRPQLRLAAGDLDKALAELLTARSIISADVRGRNVPSGFARVEAFRIGFMEGSQSCTQRFA